MKEGKDKRLIALCIFQDGRHSSEITGFLRARDIPFEVRSSFPEDAVQTDHGPDLILLDADMEGGGLVGFLEGCRCGRLAIPVLAFHNGSRGSRDAALVRMGAFDALPWDIGRWNTEVYIERAIGQARLIKQLTSMSRTDHVTGLYNQRFFYESLEREIRRCRRTEKPLCIALLDLDNFKEYNDKHGHLAGDKALAQVAKALLDSVRRGQDSAYRYGGDEFVIILPETDLSQAERTLRRVLQVVQAETGTALTFSIGISQVSVGSEVADHIRSADQAMYASKQAGGNRITSVSCEA